MWRGYRTDDKVALVFTRDILSTYLEQYFPVTLFPVDYFKESYQEFGIFYEFVNKILKYKEVFQQIPSKALETYSELFLLLHIISMKHPIFYEEAEWRIIYNYNHAASGKNLLEKSISFETINNQVQKIYKLSLDIGQKCHLGSFLNKIIIGPTSSPDTDPTTFKARFIQL